MQLDDTDTEIRRLQFEAYRRMTGEERVLLASELSEQARQATIAGIRSRNPGFDDDQVMAELVRILHGDLGDRLPDSKAP
ncbi:MAG: hypothetical protein H8E59_02270 [Actinobacteria bacterium]|nr:hypothetical protein [Actinomycetota bacterium]